MKIISERSKYHQFALYFDYDQSAVDFCRALKDAYGWQRFSFESHEGRRRWVFSEPMFVGLIQSKYPSVTVDQVVKNIIAHEKHVLEETRKRQEKMSEVKVKKDTDFRVEGLKLDLYPYQKVGVEFLVHSGGRALIADAMGLGKTAQAIAYVKHKGFKRVLVVCPASVKFAWEIEVEKWTDMKAIIIDGKTKLKDIPSDVNVWIINYDILKKFEDDLLDVNFDCIIGDEAHMIKNPQAARTKHFKKIAKYTPGVVLLTGTPLLSRPVELFTMLNIIDSRTWGSYWDYVKRYCGAYQGMWGLDVSGATHIDELHERIETYFIRRNKEDVLKELPPKVRAHIPVIMSDEMASEYIDAESDFAEYMYQGEVEQTSKLHQLSVLRQLTAVSAVGAALEKIDSIVDAGEKVLVFSPFMKPLELIRDGVNAKSVMITGNTPPADRGSIVKQFQTDDDTKVFLGGIISAGVGITLTAASNVIFLGYSWNPADHYQAEDRAHRVGQEASSVNIYQYYVPGTIDDDIRETLNNKKELFDRIIAGEVLENFTQDSIEAAVSGILTRNPMKNKITKNKRKIK